MLGLETLVVIILVIQTSKFKSRETKKIFKRYMWPTLHDWALMVNR